MTSCLYGHWAIACQWSSVDKLICPGKQGGVRPRARRRKEKGIPWPPHLLPLCYFILIYLNGFLCLLFDFLEHIYDLHSLKENLLWTTEPPFCILNT